MKKHRGLIQNSQGMTLVEVITGISLLAVAAIMLFTGFYTATRLFSHGRELRTNGQISAGAVDGSGDTQVKESITDENIWFMVEGSGRVFVDGKVHTYTAGLQDDAVRFQTIVPEEGS